MDVVPDTIVAIFTTRVENGIAGPYGVVHHEDLGSVTFSFDPSVWREKDLPESGDMLLLSNLRKKSKGWRARRAEFSKSVD